MTSSKRLKEYNKRKKLAETRAEKEQKKYFRRLEVDPMNEHILSNRPGILTFKGRMKPSMTYSDIVGTATKRQGSAVSRKAQARRAVDDFKVIEVRSNNNNHENSYYLWTFYFN